MKKRVNQARAELMVLILSLFLGGLLRFYDLNWGDHLYTHPDEYHIVAAVSKLDFPDQMHPHFFNYGTTTIYLIYFTQEAISNLFPELREPENINPFLVGRFYSALFSTLTILLVFGITAKFLQRRYALIAAALAALTPGLIQQAHFATPESNLIFFLFLSLYLLLNFIQSNKLVWLALSSIFLGVGLGVKVSGAVFLPIILLAAAVKSWPSILHITSRTALTLTLTLAAFFICAPYDFLDSKSFLSSLDYESSLALGAIPVFYTRQFIDTVPFLFQYEKIFPWALGPALTILGTIGFFGLAYRTVRKPTLEQAVILLAFLALFLPNGWMFAKWTRFISPTFPFFAILAALAIYLISDRFRHINNLFISFVLLATAFSALTFFSIYTEPDVRRSASEWMELSLPTNSTITVEAGNMVDLPLDGSFKRLSLDIYNLEENHSDRERVIQALKTSDYFIVQSRRVFANHMRLPDRFPKTSRFYQQLFANQTGFVLIKEFNSYPKLALVGFVVEFPDEYAEETWTVFDHPVIRVFKKDRQLTDEEYARLF